MLPLMFASLNERSAAAPTRLNRAGSCRLAFGGLYHLEDILFI